MRGDAFNDRSRPIEQARVIQGSVGSRGSAAGNPRVDLTKEGCVKRSKEREDMVG